MVGCNMFMFVAQLSLETGSSCFSEIHEYINLKMNPLLTICATCRMFKVFVLTTDALLLYL